MPNILLAQARIARRWSQSMLADVIGTTPLSISRWERGETRPGPYFRSRLCEAFGLSEQELGLTPVSIPREVVVARPAFVLAPALDPALPPVLSAAEFVDRAALLRQGRTRLLSETDIPLLALIGLPGVGKTTVAVALAHDAEVRRSFADGVLWAGLGPRANVQGHLARWGSMLGISAAEWALLQSLEARARALQSAIGQRHFLILIDDVWQVEDALALRIGGAHTAYIVTTRKPPVASALTSDGVTTVEPLANDDACLLLMRLASEVLAKEPELTRDLVGLAGGLPLTLTLMGHYLRATGVSGQPRRIHAALAQLHERAARMRLIEPQALLGSHPGLPRGSQLSLESVISISELALEAEARATLRALTLFPAKPYTFSEEAACVVAACEAQTLDALVDAGLLEVRGPERFTLHQAIADYARLSYIDTGAEARLVAYYADFVHRYARDYTMLEQESPNVLAALRIAHEHGWADALVRTMSGCFPLLDTQGFFDLAEVHVRQASHESVLLADPGLQTQALSCLERLVVGRRTLALADAHC
jgi:transcriptional regulator with XRE-family HTH domain